MSESDTPVETGTATESRPLSMDEGRSRIADLLSPRQEPDTASEKASEPAQEEDEAEAPEAPVEGTEEPEGSDQSETDTSEPDDAVEPKLRLSDGTEVTYDEIEEWRKGNLRQADYTRKTQELSATRKELETRQADIEQKSKTFEQQVNLAIEVAQAALPQEPDQSLMYSDPIAFMQQKAEYDARVQQLQQLHAAKQQHEQAASQERQQAFQQWAETERTRLVEAMPELRDPAKATSFNADLVRGIERYGFTKQDLSQVYDHRLILLAKDAMAYQKLMASKPKAAEKAKDAPPVQQPGRRASPGEAQTRAKKEQMDKLRKTGDRKVGQALIRDMLKAEA